MLPLPQLHLGTHPQVKHTHTKGETHSCMGPFSKFDSSSQYCFCLLFVQVVAFCILSRVFSYNQQLGQALVDYTFLAGTGISKYVFLKLAI